MPSTCSLCAQYLFHLEGAFGYYHNVGMSFVYIVVASCVAVLVPINDTCHSNNVSFHSVQYPLFVKVLLYLSLVVRFVYGTVVRSLCLSCWCPYLQMLWRSRVSLYQLSPIYVQRGQEFDDFFVLSSSFALIMNGVIAAFEMNAGQWSCLEDLVHWFSANFCNRVLRLSSHFLNAVLGYALCWLLWC